MFAGPLGGATDYTYYNIGSLVSESTVPGVTESFEYNELNLHNKHYDNDIRFFRILPASGRRKPFCSHIF